MSEGKEKVLSAIILLVIVIMVLKISEYFGADLEPDRTRSLESRLQKSEQLKSDQLTEQIMHQQLGSK